VLVHAHTTSQILNFVLDQRPLMRVLPSQGDVIWIGGWGLLGAGITVLSKRWRFGLFIILGLTIIAASYLALYYAWWLAIVSGLFNFSGGFIALIVYNLMGKKRSSESRQISIR
jgi:CHASE2 domain-containing sensor protein